VRDKTTSFNNVGSINEEQGSEKCQVVLQKILVRALSKKNKGFNFTYISQFFETLPKPKLAWLVADPTFFGW